MEDKFEKELKEILKTSSEYIEVPEKISIGIDETLAKLKPKNRKKILIKKISIVAALAFVLLTGFVTTCPTLAAEIPIINKLTGINSLFNKLTSSEYGDEFKNLSKLSNVSVAINKGVSDKGVTVTIKEIAYDEAAFYVIYDVNLDKNVTNKKYLEHGIMASTEVNGKKYEANASVPIYSDATRAEFTDVFPVTGGDTIPDKFDFNMIFTGIDNLKGSWNFKIPLVKEKLKDKVNVFKLNKVIKDGSNSIKIERVTSSPAYLSMLAEFKKYEPDKYDYAMMDSNGDEYEGVDMGGIVKNLFSTDVTFFYKQIEGSKLSSISILRPKSKSIFADDFKLKKVQYLPLNSKLPVDFSVGNNKKITIKSIGEKNDKIEIIFTAKGFPAYTFAFGGGIRIYDESMDKDSKKAYDFVRPETLGNSEYKVTLPKERMVLKDSTTMVKYNVDINKFDICIGNYDEMYDEVGRISLIK
ncbi:DUF4179 domain-containing protein [Clostridium neuense]|uniref:DUF4179 domain-containing protein n=1 Tax=Clostridium neuense TaxID=1728934 RepID=A0ABW8TB62_9CLOT